MIKLQDRFLPIVDFHTHILPGVDDGAPDVGVTEGLLNLSAKIGIDGIVATPHFYANERKLDDFLRMRAFAVEQLLSVYDGAVHPKVYLGAEVSYFHGISKSRDIRHLAISGTDLILIEMPYMTWNEKMLDELVSIKKDLRLMPVIAHLERYWKLQSRKIRRKLLELEVYLQCNADLFSNGNNKRLVNKLVKKNAIYFIGSDCHNLVTRSQNLQDAITALKKHPKGNAVLCEIAGHSAMCLTCGCPIADNNKDFNDLSC